MLTDVQGCMMADTGKRVKTWSNLFKEESLEAEEQKRRIKELEVAQGELESLSQGAAVYQGQPGTVLYKGDLSVCKEKIRKELALLRKKTTQEEGVALAF